MLTLALLLPTHVFAALTAFLARRKGRSTGWCSSAVVGGIPALVLILVEPRAGQPARFRGPLALLIFGVSLLAFPSAS